MEGKKLSENEFKNVTKDILSFFDTFCNAHGLRYFVAFGTLIGVVRHGGFIPWDDDIDVCMLRDDYEKFMHLFSIDNNPNYYILSSKSKESKTYYNNFARLCDKRVLCGINGTFDVENFGAFIDIFPLDNVPDEKDERLKFYEECQDAFINVLYSLPLRCFKTVPFRRTLKFCLNIPKRVPALLSGIDKTREARDKLLIKYDKYATKYVCCIFDTPSDNLILDRQDIEHITRARFEDIEVNIPCDFDKVLTTYYGNYMELPPEEERYSKHHFTPYWRE